MIVFSGIIPHSPILAPSLVGEHAEALARTQQAIHDFEGALYVSKPETILLISPHAHTFPETFSGNASPSLHVGLTTFGDHGTSLTLKSDFLVLDRIHRSLRESEVPFLLVSEQELDYGLSVPLIHLTQHLPNVALLPLSVSQADARAHVTYGQALHQVVQSEQRRIAVIASADLGHHGAPNAPANPTSSAGQFDALIRGCVSNMDLEGLLKLSDPLLTEAKQCGYKPIVTLLALLDGLHVTPRELCYEVPLGVGLLTSVFDLS